MRTPYPVKISVAPPVGSQVQPTPLIETMNQPTQEG